VKREEFCALPPAIALGLVYDMAKAKLEPMRCPDVPRPPKYDGRITRKGGEYSWLSEMLLKDLEWWFEARRKSASEGGQYAEQNAKQAKAIEQWILWRKLFPDTRWNGIRGEDRVTAALPSPEPTLHKWNGSGGGGRAGGTGSKSKGGSQRNAPTPPPEDEGGSFDF
jgi:hypothetical protein